METEVGAVLRIYYGSGQTYESATTVVEKVSPSGVYKITVENDGDKFFFLIPKNIEILPITMSGFDVPMITYDVDVSGSQYKVYESTNGYYAGTYNLVVDIPHEDPVDPQKAVVYYGSASQYDEITRYRETSDPKGVYDISVDREGDKIFFIVPVNMSINEISMGGFSFPYREYTVVMNGVQKKVYESNNGYKVGLYKITVL